MRNVSGTTKNLLDVPWSLQLMSRSSFSNIVNFVLFWFVEQMFLFFCFFVCFSVSVSVSVSVFQF